MAEQRGAPAESGRPAIFLDRDGTLIVERYFLGDPRGVELLPGAAEALCALRAAGFALVLASNQSGVARGYFDEAAVRAVNAELERQLAARGARIDSWKYCPHLPDAPVARYARVCECRKPAPGMLLEAARELGLDCARSWAIGDSLRDLAAGAAAGARGLLVLTGNGVPERAKARELGQEPKLVAADMSAAAALVLAARAG